MDTHLGYIWQSWTQRQFPGIVHVRAVRCVRCRVMVFELYAYPNGIYSVYDYRSDRVLLQSEVLKPARSLRGAKMAATQALRKYLIEQIRERE